MTFLGCTANAKHITQMKACIVQHDTVALAHRHFSSTDQLAIAERQCKAMTDLVHTPTCTAGNLLVQADMDIN